MEYPSSPAGFHTPPPIITKEKSVGFWRSIFKSHSFDFREWFSAAICLLLPKKTVDVKTDWQIKELIEFIHSVLDQMSPRLAAFLCSAILIFVFIIIPASCAFIIFLVTLNYLLP